MTYGSIGDRRSPAPLRRTDNLFRLTLLLLLLVLSGCMNQENFSQRDGFAEFFSAHPRAETIPTDEEQSLLRRYRPHLWVDASAEGPIDFYADYVASGELRGPDEQVISREVNQSLLNEHRHSPNVVFIHTPDCPTAYLLSNGRCWILSAIHRTGTNLITTPRPLWC